MSNKELFDLDDYPSDIFASMPNNYFRFKQFTVQQDKCAMKVCTDACVFGSSLPPAPSKGGREWRILDVGTGTGLLALMYAQKNPDAIIDAVEIDDPAAQQAKENFQGSPWKERLQVYTTSIQQFCNYKSWSDRDGNAMHRVDQVADQPINRLTKYDLIISNPPFFENHLKSNNAKRNLALHSEELSLEELLNAVTNLLKEDGNFSVLLPNHRTQRLINLALQQSFHLLEKIFVRQTPRHNYFRSILLFGRQEVSTKQSEIIIRDEDGRYTNEFVELLKDYYLAPKSPPQRSTFKLPKI